MAKDTIEISKESFMKGIIVVLAVLLLISIYTGGFGFKSGSDSGMAKGGYGDSPSAPSGNSGSGSGAAADMVAVADDDAFKGDADAPVTIVEFSDYECGFCSRFYAQTLPQIQSQYIDTGKVKFVYRDFPLSFHPNAQKAAEAAECAGEQGKYFEMHDLMFENGVSGGVSQFKGYAQQIGLDTSAFNNCLDSGEMAAEVQKDMADGQALGIRGTPGFIINGETVSGALPFENFKQIIDAKLAEA